MTAQFHRTNLNLYVEDVIYMQRTFGRGWTEQARDIIHQELKAIRARTAFTLDLTVPEDRAIWRKLNLGK